MTDYEARVKIYNRLCNESRKDPEKWLSRDFLFGELKLIHDEFMGALNWLTRIRGDNMRIVDTEDGGKSLRLGPPGRKCCEDGTEPDLSN